MKEEKFDFIDENKALTIINNRLKAVGKKVREDHEDVLLYEMKSFFKTEELYAGTVALKLSGTDLFVMKERADGKKGEHSYPVDKI